VEFGVVSIQPALATAVVPAALAQSSAVAAPAAAQEHIVYGGLMRLLVTGAAGFIGSNLVDCLLQRGHDVVGLDNLSRGRLANLEEALRSPRFSFAQADVTDPNLTAVVDRIHPEAICHLAAQIDVRLSVSSPVVDVQQNVVGTVNMLEAARRADCGKFVFCSSGGSIYGSSEDLPVSETAPLAPESPYAASKAACELYLHSFASLYGLKWTSLALSNVYGPRQDPYGEAGVVALFTAALLEGRQATIFGDGEATRDFVFVSDVATAFALAVENDGLGQRLNVGTGTQTSVSELYDHLARIVGSSRPPRYAGARLGELRASCLDPSAARDVLGWAPAHPLEEGLAETVDWLRHQATGAAS
jgi:UDP-glucose 4-epimerase